MYRLATGKQGRQADFDGGEKVTRNSWRRLADGVFQTRLAFLDVTVGLICGDAEVLLIDCGTTRAEAAGISRDVREMTGRHVSHVVLTHDHFDHVLGASVFADAALYAAPAVAVTFSTGVDRLRDDALAHGAEPAAVDEALATPIVVTHLVRDAVIDLGARSVAIRHLGAGHTDHDLVVVAPPRSDPDPTVVFCGDLVEESGDPVAGEDSDPARWPQTLDRLLTLGGPAACYVPGHGAAVDADFIRAQRDWLAGRAGG